jgi:hypothetical protein
MKSQCYKTDVVEDLLRILLNKTMVNSIIPRNLMSEDEDCVLELEASQANNCGQKKEVFNLLEIMMIYLIPHCVDSTITS